MIIIRLLFALLLIYALGDSITRLFARGWKGFPVYFRAAIGFPAGLASTSILIFLIGIMHIPIRLFLLFPLMLAITFGFYIFGSRRDRVILRGPSFNWSWDFMSRYSRPDISLIVESLLGAYIALKVFIVFLAAIIKPIIDIDAIAQYAIVAKAVFLGGSFLDPYVLRIIGDKPPFQHFSLAIVPIGIGSWNDCLAKINLPILYLCFVLILYFVIRKFATRLCSLFSVFLFVSLPFVSFHAATAYADFPQMVYYSAATFFMFLFMNELVSDDDSAAQMLSLFALFLGFSVWIKRGGLYLAGIDFIVLTLFLFFNRAKISKKTMMKFLVPAVIFFLIVIPWIAYGQMQTLARTLTQLQSEIGGDVRGGQSFMDKTSFIIGTAMNKLFFYADWNLLWAAFVISTLFGVIQKYKGITFYVLLTVALNVVALFLQFRAGGSFVWLLDGTLFDRLVMAQVPLLLFFIAEVLGKMQIIPAPNMAGGPEDINAGYGPKHKRNINRK